MGSVIRARLQRAIAAVVLGLAACAPAAPPSAPTATPPPALPTAVSASPAAASKPGAATGPRGGALRVATLGGAPTVLHPYPESQYNTTPRADADVLMNRNVIDVDYDRLDFVADPRRSLARDLPRISSDGRTLTFTLRHDIFWSDGRPITSADFQFAWDNASKKENNYVGLQTLERIESYRTPDPMTIEVTLKQPLARFLALSTAAAIAPVPKHVWEGKPWLDPAGNPEILKPTVVAGPYLPKEITAERHSYSRLPRFWGQEPNLDEIAFVNATPTTVIELLKTRQVEWSQSVPPAQYEDARSLANANVVEWSGATGSYRTMEFNSQRAPFTDKRFREALARSVNREDLIQFEENLAVAQFGIFTQGSKWRNDNVDRYAFDLARSKQLLQEAGFKLEGGSLRDPAGQAVKIEIIWPTTSQPRGKIATYLQQQCKALGIESTVTGLEFNAFVDKQSRQKDFDVAMGTWSATLDPDGSKSQLITGGTQNSVGYSNPRVDELFERGAAEQDDTRRKQIYDEIQSIVATDLPIYYMVTLKNVTAFDKRVGGVSPLKGGDILRQNNLQVLDWYLTQ